MQQLQLIEIWYDSAFVKVYNTVSLHYFHSVQITAAHTFQVAQKPSDLRMHRDLGARMAVSSSAPVALVCEQQLSHPRLASPLPSDYYAILWINRFPLLSWTIFFSNLKVFLLEQTREDIYPTPTGSLTNCSLCSLVPSFSLLHIKETTALKPLMIIFECDPRHKPVLEWGRNWMPSLQAFSFTISVCWESHAIYIPVLFWKGSETTLDSQDI